MGARKKSEESRYREIRNAKATRNYLVGERFEVGLVLLGTEVKAIRTGNAQISESFCRIDKGQVWLFNAHVGPYEFGNSLNHEPRRKRKILLNRREINKLIGAVEAGGKTLIPLRLYIKHGLVKMEIALCKGKKLHDKRETLKGRDIMREAEREMRQQGPGRS